MALTWVKRAALDIIGRPPQVLEMIGSSKQLMFALAALLLLAPAGQAGDLRGARIEDLRGELRSARWGPPRAGVYELKQLRRRLAEQRVDAPGDPRLEALELQRRHDQWQAERALRQAARGASRAWLEGMPGRLPAPGDLRAPTDLDIRGERLPIGTGKRFLFVQSGLRDVHAALARGAFAAAADHLAQAESDLRNLRAVASAADPNLVALAAEIEALRARIGAAPG